MLVIRLSRTGRKKQPYYRVVVAEKSAPIKGRLIEVLGHFNPRTKELKIDVERAKARVKDGAQPSETAEALLEKAGVLKREAITEKNRRPERKSKKEMKAEAEGGDDKGAAPAAAADGDAPAADGDDAKGDDADGKQGDAKPEEKPAEEAKADEKPAAKAEAKQSDDDDKPNDKEAKEGDSK